MDFAYILNTMKILLSGVQNTLFLFVVVVVLSIPLGFFLTMLAKLKIPPLRWLITTYIFIMRGTPLLLQLLFIYFGLPVIPVIGKYFIFSGLTSATIGFVLNYAAYFAEIFRGGLISIDKGQYEASKVLGLTKTQTMYKVILPQMFRVTLPTVTSEIVNLIKDTALLYAVAVQDILYYAKTTVARDANITAFFLAGVIYLVINTVLQIVLKKIENKFNKQEHEQ
ncbi:MAG: amino acid ABC transporter permease [Oscillospiraceae bacterium]